MTSSTSCTISGSSAEVGSSNRHDLRLHAQCACDGDALLLATGQLAGIFVGLLGDAHPHQQLARRGLGLRFRHLADLDRRDHQVLQHGQMGKQVELLEHHADIAADHIDIARGVIEFDAVDHDAPLAVFLQAVDAADHGRLARP